MKYHLVAMYDKRVDAFMTPVCVVSIPQAQRSFLKETAEGGDGYAMRGDLQLYHMGSFDECSGVFSPPDGANGPLKLADGA